MVKVRSWNFVQPRLPVESADDLFLRMPSFDGLDVTLCVTAAGDRIYSETSIDPPEGRASAKRAWVDVSEQAAALHNLYLGLARARRHLLALILQELALHDRHTLLGGGPANRQWSLDGIVWHDFELGQLFFWGERLTVIHSLDSKMRDQLQRLLDSGEQPFIAVDYLREAERSQDDHFAWVSAAVAAELAIKEALIRLEPRLEAVLLEVPSPPLRKMYGVLLETYGGERSDYVAALEEGASKRNVLVHRPGPPSFGPQERVEYVDAVRAAITHLIALCRRKRRPAGNNAPKAAGGDHGPTR